VRACCNAMQGDRLNEMKLRSQRIHPPCLRPTAYSPSNNNNEPIANLIGGRSLSAAAVALPSPTTPIKQLKLSTAPRPYLPHLSGQPSTEISARRQFNMKMPISKVTVATTYHRLSTSKGSPKSSIRLQPYSTTNINFATKYGLRPRKTLVSPVRFDPSHSPSENTLLQRQHHSSSAILNSYTKTFKS